MRRKIELLARVSNVVMAVLLFNMSGSFSNAFSQEVRPAPHSPQRKDEADEVERVETNLVTVPVSVMDRVGRYITNLRREDFQVFEDGVEQEVAVFSPVE